MKSIIGSFTVRDTNNHARTVIITQELILNHEDVITGAVKYFTLDTEYGEKIAMTDNPEIFRQKDGTLLRKSGYIQSHKEK